MVMIALFLCNAPAIFNHYPSTISRADYFSLGLKSEAGDSQGHLEQVSTCIMKIMHNIIINVKMPYYMYMIKGLTPKGKNWPPS